MMGRNIRRTLHSTGLVAAFTLILTTGALSEPELREEDGVHLGVASCAGDNCHGATERRAGSSVAQNEYLILFYRRQFPGLIDDITSQN